MIVRCPQCEFIRTVPDNKIPPTAQFATCPRCSHRFRFRILEPQPEFPKEAAAAPEPAPAPSPVRDDIWEAMDVLHKKWEQKSEPKQDNAPKANHASHQTHITRSEQTGKTTRISAVAESTAPAQTNEPQATQSNPLSNIKLDSTQHSLFDCLSQTAPCQPSSQNDTPENTEQAAQEDDSGSGATRSALPEEPLASEYFSVAEEYEREFSPTEAACKNDQSSVPQDKTDNDETGNFPESDYAEYYENHSDPSGETLSGSFEDPAIAENQEGSSEPAQEEVFTTASMKLEAQVVQPFFYRNDNLTVEEKVSHDIQLMEGSEDIPVRDLGQLDEHFRKLEQQLQAEEERNASIPWEQPKRHGWTGSFLRTLFMMLFTPAYSFPRLSSSGSLAPAYLFLLVLGYVLILSTACWNYALTLLLAPEDALQTPPMDLPSILLLAPVLLGISLLAVSGCAMLLLRLFTRKEASLLLICRIFCYASAPYLLSVIPFVGTIAATGWFCYILTVAFHSRLQTSWLQSALIPVPPALLLLGLVTAFFLM